MRKFTPLWQVLNSGNGFSDLGMPIWPVFLIYENLGFGLDCHFGSRDGAALRGRSPLPLWQSSQKSIFSKERITCHLGSHLTRAGTYGTMHKTDKNGKGGKIGTIGTFRTLTFYAWVWGYL